MVPSALLVTLVVALLGLRPAAATIECYQCSSTDHHEPYTCPEIFNSEGDPDGYLPEMKPCDQVHGASYCIKQTGRFEVIACVQCAAPNCSAHTEPTPCDHVFEALYCVKSDGLFGGGLGTKRFCSALDVGNYCNYVRQPGDDKEYRSCVYTCSTDGCNPAAPNALPLRPLILLLPVVVALLAART